MEKIRVGIIGTGVATGISMAHYKGFVLSPDAEFTAVYNRHPESAAKWCERYGISGVKVCGSLEEFFGQVDAVSICTPNNTHMEYVKLCLEAGKDVFCEKPFSAGNENKAGLEEVKALCETSGKISMINLNYRRLPGVAALAGMVREGVLGDIVLYRQCMGGGRLANEKTGFEWRMSREKSGSGSLGDFGSHLMDTMLYITGCDTADIVKADCIEKTQIKERAFEGGFRKVENDDLSVAQGFLGKGTLFSFFTSRVGAVGNLIEVYGTKGIATFDMAKPAELKVLKREAGKGFFGPFETITVEDPFYENCMAAVPIAPYAACAKNAAEFVRCVREKEQPDTTILYGIRLEEALDIIDINAEKI